MQTSIYDFAIFTKVSRSSHFLLVLARAPRMGQPPSQVTPRIAPSLCYVQVDLRDGLSR
jgi:hypothetical protein